jgi:hypothetical protein
MGGEGDKANNDKLLRKSHRQNCRVLILYVDILKSQSVYKIYIYVYIYIYILPSILMNSCVHANYVLICNTVKYNGISKMKESK